MTVADVINYADKMRPNRFPVEVKLGWINDLEENIQINIWLRRPENLRRHMDTEEPVYVPGRLPLYWSWLAAMIDMLNGEITKYQNSMDFFNQNFDAYMTWYANNVQPGQEVRYVV